MRRGRTKPLLRRLSRCVRGRVIPTGAALTVVAVLGLAHAVPYALGQAVEFSPGTLDPTRSLPAPGIGTSWKPLPEEYIWTKDASAATEGKEIDNESSGLEPRYLRATFRLKDLPAEATFYVGGVRAAKVYLNGNLLLDTTTNPALPFYMQVFTADAKKDLRLGINVLAMEVVRGDRNDTGRSVVAKIVPASLGVMASPLIVTNGKWKASTEAAEGWNASGYNDASWPPAYSLGSIDLNPRYLQGDIDTGLYQWPGYTGVSNFLARYQLPPVRVVEIFAGESKIENVQALTSVEPLPAEKQFTVRLTSADLIAERAPTIGLDFGKEVAGWIEFVSDSDSPIELTVQYGESRDEVEHDPYQGVDPVYIPAHGTAHGPKSAFRYAKVIFLRGSGPLRFQAIRLNGIYYPVAYKGSFECSDDLLNRIWEVGSYTAHISMQDDIWDAPKRDRLRWMGDLDVSGVVIDSVFADRFLMEDTLTKLIGPSPVEGNVNRIAGYSAFWVTGLAEFDRHFGDREYLEGLHRRLTELLSVMEKEFSPDDLFANLSNSPMFVDWSPYLYSDTPESRMVTDLEIYRGFVEGAALLRQLDDPASAERYEQFAARMKKAAQAKYFDPKTGSYGGRWQANAMAVYSGLADKEQYASIWKNSLASVNSTDYTAFVITPYYGYYLLSAMAQMDKRPEALAWIRKYWGGMLAEGATTFWEAYDPGWPKRHFHTSLEANGNGYFVSLAHGWSSGPTAWLMEQILGIRPTTEGVREVTIRPDLAGLAWAKGTEPTPSGPIHVAWEQGSDAPLEVDLPHGIRATILVPVPSPAAEVKVNGTDMRGDLVEDGSRRAIVLDNGGHFVITTGAN